MGTISKVNFVFFYGDKEHEGFHSGSIPWLISLMVRDASCRLYCLFLRLQKVKLSSWNQVWTVRGQVFPEKLRAIDSVVGTISLSGREQSPFQAWAKSFVAHMGETEAIEALEAAWGLVGQLRHLNEACLPIVWWFWGASLVLNMYFITEVI
jgi:hypothetical protein